MMNNSQQPTEPQDKVLFTVDAETFRQFCELLDAPPRTILAFRAKKIPTDKSWDFDKWWRRRESNPRPQVRYSQDYMLSLVIWVSPRVRQPAGLRLASRFDGSTRQSGHTAQRG